MLLFCLTIFSKDSQVFRGVIYRIFKLEDKDHPIATMYKLKFAKFSGFQGHSLVILQEVAHYLLATFVCQ
jgi:hypothetical protein